MKQISQKNIQLKYSNISFFKNSNLLDLSESRTTEGEQKEKNSDLIQRIPRTISIKRGGRRPRSIRPMTRDPRVRFTGQLVQIPRSRIIINDSLPIPFEYRKEDVGKTVWNWGLRQFSHSNVAAITTIAASPR